MSQVWESLWEEIELGDVGQSEAHSLSPPWSESDNVLAPKLRVNRGKQSITSLVVGCSTYYVLPEEKNHIRA